VPIDTVNPKQCALLSSLDSESAYVVDCGGSEVFLWVGERVPPRSAVRTVAVKLGEKVGEMRKVGVGGVRRVRQGRETWVFGSKFGDWAKLVKQRALCATPYGFAQVREQQEVGNVAMSNYRDMATSAAEMLRAYYERNDGERGEEGKAGTTTTLTGTAHEVASEDDGEEDQWIFTYQCEVVCWVLEHDELQSVDDDEIGHLFSHNSYLFLAIPTPHLNPSPPAVVFFWQGTRAESSDWLRWCLHLRHRESVHLSEVAGDRALVTRRVRQGQEPRAFRALFGADNNRQRLIVHDRVWRRREGMMRVCLYRVGMGPWEGEDVRVEQVEPVVRSLHSQDVFIAIQTSSSGQTVINPDTIMEDEKPPAVWFWLGRMADPIVQEAGANVAFELMAYYAMQPDSLDIVVVEENQVHVDAEQAHR